jgi:membrane protein insertase Oxa1/YidC/SpoIIIJ
MYFLASQYIAVEMKSEGALWFDNLFLPDQFYILPIILLSTNLLIGAVGIA